MAGRTKKLRAALQSAVNRHGLLVAKRATAKPGRDISGEHVPAWQPMGVDTEGCKDGTIGLIDGEQVLALDVSVLQHAITSIGRKEASAYRRRYGGLMR
mmetsp:Transcript_7847/g.16602  ORF Transcript_7847/g.16602 Transcript_7847/m.16602 type:complete len:99 (+) Transcript_7847:3-299(+)